MKRLFLFLALCLPAFAFAQPLTLQDAVLMDVISGASQPVGGASKILRKEGGSLLLKSGSSLLRKEQ